MSTPVFITGKKKHVSSILIGGATKETLQRLTEEMLQEEIVMPEAM